MAQIGSADSRVTYDSQNHAVRMWFDPSPLSFSKNPFVAATASERSYSLISGSTSLARLRSDSCQPR